MKILHHNDDDGRCAAAIVTTLLAQPWDVPQPSDFIEFYYGQDLESMTKDIKYKENEDVYIVDISLDDTVMKFITNAYAHGCRIYHFDHHASTFRIMKNLNENELKMFNSEKFTYIHNDEISGSMITFLFSCFNTNERDICNDMSYDFSDDYSHLKVIPPNGPEREYGIPLAIRYIDDNDTWRHQNVETKFFSLAFSMEEDKHPYNKMWEDLLFGSNYAVMDKYITSGELLYKYQEAQNKKVMRNSFVSLIGGIEMICVNSCLGNSRLFGDEFNNYDAVCKFGYDGGIHKWRYTLYGSDERDPEQNIDLSKIAESYGGGGHEHACGFELDYNLFDKECPVL